MRRDSLARRASPVKRPRSSVHTLGIGPIRPRPRDNGLSALSLVASSLGELEEAMKPPGRLLLRRQDVRRSERDLVSVLIAEGSLSSDWLVKRVPGCALKPPMGSEPPPSDAADPVRPGAG